MKDERKTKGQLIAELNELRHQNDELQRHVRNLPQNHSTESEFVRSKNRVSFIFENNPAVIYTCNYGGDWACTFVSENVKNLVGYEMKDFIADRDFWVNNIHPDDKEQVLADLDRLLKSDYHSLEYRFLHSDGTYRWIHDELRVVRDEDGRPVECIGYWSDITPNKQIEHELREKKRFLLSIFSSIADGISILDRELNIVQVNAAMEKWYSYSLPLAGKKCYEAYHSRTEHCDVCPTLRTLETGEAAFEIVPKRGPGGDITGWLDLYSFPLIDEMTGELKGVIEYVRDITERKNAEDELVKSEKVWTHAMDFFDDAIYIIDMNDRVVRANHAFYTMTGLTPEKTIGRDITSLIHPEGEAIPCPVCAARRERKDAIITMESDHPDNPAGRPISVTVRMIRDESGEPVSVLMGMRDLTERRQTEKVLREREERYRTLVETIPHGIGENDQNGIITLSNAAHHEMMGYEYGELIGKPIWHVLPSEKEEKKLREYLAYLVREQPAPTAYVSQNKTKDGRLIDVQVDWTYKRDDSGQVIGFTSIITDITERKKLEAQLLHAQKMEAVGQLAGGVAHDFNNILTAIIGYGNIMRMKMKSDDPLRVNLDNILGGAERAAHLTQSLLAFSRKQIVETKPVDLNDIVRRIEKILLRIIGEDIELTTHLASGQITIAADSGQIEQVLMNLATNARDSMPDGGKLLIETEHVELDSGFAQTHGYGTPGQYALLTVSDTGEGIETVTRERIFEPFFTTKDVGKGTGLGLSITYGIVKQHNGYISVSGEVGTGTTFQIYFPLIQDDVVASTREDVTQKGGTETVLIAEDDEAIRMLLKEVLTTAGYTVIETDDGDTAFDTFVENSDVIQMLVSDVIMPKRNGKELYDEIKKVNPDVKALFLSGYAGEVIQEKGMLDEGVHFVYKPISPNTLLQKVREVLDE